MQELSGIRFGTQIAAAARAHGIDPKLLAAVAAQETGGPGASSGNNVVGDHGHGHGVFQIDDRSWAFARSAAAMDPAQNADKAASILADNLGRYGGDVRKALSAYNSGSPTATGTATTWGDGRTLGYADSVLRHYAELGGDAREQLIADNRDSSIGVNALARRYGAMQSRPSCATTQVPVAGSSDAAALAALQAPVPLPPAATPTDTRWRSWSSLNAGAADPAQDADRVLAGLVGASTDDDSDARA
ncbi:MAG: transglycosylase SLT domain-containing protein [Candidatus Eremiobacteraeota bacterium]|nr:transglycosylase SLT domain-containing protein [Candidatus Eremiobacteraeota bacterium]